MRGQLGASYMTARLIVIQFLWHRCTDERSFDPQGSWAIDVLGNQALADVRATVAAIKCPYCRQKENGLYIFSNHVCFMFIGSWKDGIKLECREFLSKNSFS